MSVEQHEAVGTLAVEDNGEGIPEEHLARVFDRFHRVDPARDRRSGGAGLGLAIAHTLIAAHGGSISIARRDEGGTRAIIRLPLLAANEDIEHAAPPSITARR